MAEKTTVAFRVDEGVKEEWEDAAESPEYDSLSHLIRLAVQREIADTEKTHDGTQSVVDIEGNSEVLDSLTRLERAVTDIQDEVKAVGRERQAEELYDLEQVLLEVLPSVERTTLQELKDYTPEDVDEEAFEYDSIGVPPETIAARIGADEQDVSDALHRLDDNTGRVGKIETAFMNQPRYFRVE